MFRISCSSSLLDGYDEPEILRCSNPQICPTGADVRHEEHDLPVLRIMTDRGTEYCGRVDKHDFQLFLAINDIDHTKTKVKSPQTNGICERFHKTILQEFYQVAFRKKLYDSIDALQADLDEWLHHYNHERTHQGKMCCGRTPIETMIDGKEIWQEKFVN
jgi:transposase InsO family protein